MSRYANGRSHEYLVRDDLEAAGYWCIRAAGSKGKADLVALRLGEVLLVQVKISGPQISPQERLGLFQTSLRTGAKPLVAHKPFRQPITYRRLTGAGPKDWEPWEVALMS